MRLLGLYLDRWESGKKIEGMLKFLIFFFQPPPQIGCPEDCAVCGDTATGYHYEVGILTDKTSQRKGKKQVSKHPWNTFNLRAIIRCRREAKKWFGNFRVFYCCHFRCPPVTVARPSFAERFSHSANSHAKRAGIASKCCRKVRFG